MRTAALLVTYGVRSGWHRVLTPLVWLISLPTRLPTRLLIAPQDIRTADPTVASDIYSGYFSFGGQAVNAHGRSPFELEPPGPRWAEALHGFGWLRHLRAADTALARANGRALIEDWIGNAKQMDRSVVWQPGIVARRLLSWLSQSPIVLDGADGQFYRRLMKSMGQQTAVLRRQVSNGLAGEERLLATLAVAEMGICAEGLQAWQRQSSRNFVEELHRQILPDGGHVSRNPERLVALLLDLLPLRQAYAARGAEVPAPLLNAIDRMMPMLRMFRHPDGSLALFNGMGVTQPEVLATVLAYDDAGTLPLTNAPYSGYQRVEAGDSVLIVEAGRPPPPVFSRRAHAGTLSFEFSAAGHRLIVNCGARDPAHRAMVQAARFTAAHSTLVLSDTSSSRFCPVDGFVAELDGAIVAGPKAVTVDRAEDAATVRLDLSHDGYAREGFVHRRSLVLSQAGTHLLGEDRLVETASGQGTGALPFAIRFHLHPLARAAFADDGQTLAIRLPGGELWLFEAGGWPIEIEESIFFASAEGPRRTEQIVLQASTADVTTLRWSLTRHTPPQDGTADIPG